MVGYFLNKKHNSNENKNQNFKINKFTQYLNLLNYFPVQVVQHEAK